MHFMIDPIAAADHAAHFHSIVQQIGNGGIFPHLDLLARGADERLIEYLAAADQVRCGLTVCREIHIDAMPGG